MDEVRSIEIVFENCDCLTLKRNLLGGVYISGIHETIRRVASNSLCKFKSADEIVLEVLPEAAEQDYCPFGLEDEKAKKMKRLSQLNDITAVIIMYKNGSREYIYTDYDEGDQEGQLGAPNINQKIYMSPGKHLYIVIARGKEISDYFTEECIKRSDKHSRLWNEQEEFIWGEEGIPAYYHFVYMEFVDNKNEYTGIELAVRVPCRDDGGKTDSFFIFGESSPIQRKPVAWRYLDHETEKTVCRKMDDSASRSEIISFLSASKPCEDDKDLMKAWKTAWDYYSGIIEKDKKTGKSEINSDCRQDGDAVLKDTFKTLEKIAEKSEQAVTSSIKKGGEIAEKGIKKTKEFMESDEAKAAMDKVRSAADKCIVKAYDFIFKAKKR